MNEDFDGSKASDRRIATRRQSGAHVWADPGGVMPAIDCRIIDISETGAKLTVEGSVEGLHLKEFFLLLSSTGLAYRRCELSWVNGDQIGVNFIKTGDRKKKSARRGQDAEV